MGEIISLGASSVVDQKSIVELEDQLKELLEQNRRGELKAIAFATVDNGDSLQTWWVGGTCMTSRLVGAVRLLGYRLEKAWDEAV